MLTTSLVRYTIHHIANTYVVDILYISVDHVSGQGDTALSFASKRGITSAVNDLVHCGAQIERDTTDGRYS